MTLPVYGLEMSRNHHSKFVYENCKTTQDPTKTSLLQVSEAKNSGVYIQLFQLTLSDQSFKPTRQDRIVVSVEEEDRCTCQILMRCNNNFFLSFFLFRHVKTTYLSHSKLKRNFRNYNYARVKGRLRKMTPEGKHIYSGNAHASRTKIKISSTHTCKFH